jgi:putative peptidoglycan lipid II flippase
MENSTTDAGPVPPPKTTTHTVARAAGLLMVANLSSRILGLLRDTVIAVVFGQNAQTDVYRQAFRIPDALFFLLAGGVFSSAFLPVFSRYLSEEKEDDAWEVFSTITTFLALGVGALVLLGEVFTEPLTYLVAPGFSPEKRALTAHLTRIILPGQISFFLGGVFIAVLNARNHFVTMALAPNIYNLGILLGALLLGPYMGVEGMTWGVLAGAIVGNFLLPAYSLRRMGARYHWSLNLRHPGVKQVGKLALPVLLGLGLPQAYSFINGIFASTMADGVVSGLENANRLMQAPLGIVGQAISIAVYPTLVALAIANKHDEMRHTFSRGLKTLWFLSIPLSLFLMVFSTDIVALLMQYGKFKAADTELTAQMLVLLSIGMFAFSSQSLLNRAFYAVQNTLTPVLVGTGSTVLFIGLNYALSHLWQHRGLALAGSIAAMLHVIWMLLALRRRTGLYIEGLPQSLAKILTASGLAAAAGWGMRFLIDTHLGGFLTASWQMALANLLVAGGAGAAVFLGAAQLLRCEELQSALEILRRRRRRAAKASKTPEPTATA